MFRYDDVICHFTLSADAVTPQQDPKSQRTSNIAVFMLDSTLWFYQSVLCPKDAEGKTKFVVKEQSDWVYNVCQSLCLKT